MCEKLQAASAVEKVPLGKRAVSSMSAKGGKIRSGEPSSVEDHKRVHMPVGRVVVMEGGNELNGLSIALFEFEHGGDGEIA